MKKLIKIALVLVVLVGVLVGIAFFYMDSIAKAAIEKGATASLGVKTTLGTADVQPFAGRLELSKLNVANPEGFKSPHFLTMNDGATQVALGTLRQDTVEIPELTLTGIDMNLERAGSKSNYDVILKNMKGTETQPPPADGGKKYVIKQVRIRDIKVHVDMLPIGGDATKLTVPIDEIKLDDFGSDTPNGADMSQLVNTLVKAIFTAAVQKGGGLIPAEMLGDLTGHLAGLKGLGNIKLDAGSAVKALGDLGGDATKKLEDVAEQGKKALDDLGGLLGGDKKKD